MWGPWKQKTTRAPPPATSNPDERHEGLTGSNVRAHPPQGPPPLGLPDTRCNLRGVTWGPVSYTHLRAHETSAHL
eukprot:6030124-Alexandrium_andersonii.AAC.1